ncbi:MAG TPA: type I DNA topoisomerase [Chitinophagales bacterium]|nr:type I DNA topoisomerase [Chitinophagales bacterium]
MAKNLMIVESPAKAKKIEQYLGGEFTVKSSYGHVRDLPKGDAAIDVNNNYAPRYEVSDDKKQVVAELKQLAAKADSVWLATDEDREGEAISWHLCEVLNLDVAQTNRIVFNEITKPAIQKAVQNPRRIDTNLVNAQQARRVLDRLVGFEISPILWKKISRSNSLSAGRVQSVAVRLIVEREREIQDFEASPYFKIIAIFKVKDKNGKLVTFKAELPEKLKDEAVANKFLQKCIGADYTITDIQVKPAKKSPAPPFITSTLQQEASRKLGFGVSRTMQVAQKLYESGKITYMRTDSTYLSETAIKAASDEIMANYGVNYLQNRQFKTKSALAQEAHEAIRPTYFDQHEAGDTSDEKKLYNLIWKRTLASQMADAQLERTTATIQISTQPQDLLIAQGEVLKFDGFLRLYRESALDEESEEEQSSMLPPLHVGQLLDLLEMRAIQKFLRPSARYNEASLVKKLEELGIGRPSTYAPTIKTIQERGYVVREDREGHTRDYQQLILHGKDTPKANQIVAKTLQERIGVEKSKLFPTDMGMLVNDFLNKHFADIIDYAFTAQIEKQFDEIATGKEKWTQVIDDFYKPFHQTVIETEQHAERETGHRILGHDPKTGKEVTARLGKFGPMVQIGTNEDTEKPVFASIRPPFTLTQITLEQALEMFKLPRTIGEINGEPLKANEGRFGPYIQYQGAYYTLPKGESPLEVSLERAIQIIEAKKTSDAEKVIKTFPENPNVQVLKGRFGPYVKYGKDNIKIPKGQVPDELTYEQIQALMGEKNQTNQQNALKVFPEDANIQILAGKYGAYIKANGENYKIPKDTTVETLTYEMCKQIIEKGNKKTTNATKTTTTKTSTKTTSRTTKK